MKRVLPVKGPKLHSKFITRVRTYQVSYFCFVHMVSCRAQGILKTFQYVLIPLTSESKDLTMRLNSRSSLGPPKWFKIYLNSSFDYTLNDSLN